MKLKVDPLSIFLIALLIGAGLGGTGGYFVGRNSIETITYEIDIDVADIETSVKADNNTTTEVVTKTEVITEINEYNCGTNKTWLYTNFITNTTQVTNTNYFTHSITNSYSNLFDFNDISNKKEVLSNIIIKLGESNG